MSKKPSGIGSLSCKAMRPDALEYRLEDTRRSTHRPTPSTSTSHSPDRYFLSPHGQVGAEPGDERQSTPEGASSSDSTSVRQAESEEPSTSQPPFSSLSSATPRSGIGGTAWL